MREEKAKETPSENTGQNRGGKKRCLCFFFSILFKFIFYFYIERSLSHSIRFRAKPLRYSRVHYAGQLIPFWN